MKDDRNNLLQQLTHGLLYEGYTLYPYKTTTLKNKIPIPFGVLYPKNYCQYNKYVNSEMQTECITLANDLAELIVQIKFLQISYDNKGWTAIEHEVSSEKISIKNLPGNKNIIPFQFHLIEGTATIQAAEIRDIKNAYLLSVIISNTTPVKKTGNITEDEILKYALVSTHTILKISDGEFVSLQKPDKEWRDLIKLCENKNTCPVLIDAENSIMLSSPIILYDYPQINASGILEDQMQPIFYSEKK
jgi:hypothetical protein